TTLPGFSTEPEFELSPQPYAAKPAANGPVDTYWVPGDDSGLRLSVVLESSSSYLLWIWIAGVIGYGGYQLFVIWQMCRLMRMAVPDARIDRAMHRIAKAAKVKNYPTARLVPWVGSPMLWGLGGTSVIVLPKRLFEQLEDDAADTLLRHELAHFQRGDQWVRILEVTATSLFWWHPIVWLAKKNIEVYEEQCCDSWVVRQDYDNRRLYAEALLDTVDFISDAPDTPMPMVASGLGRVPLLRQRIKSIMNGERQELDALSRGVGLLMLAMLPVQPYLLQARTIGPGLMSPGSRIADGWVHGLREHHARIMAESTTKFLDGERPNTKDVDSSIKKQERIRFDGEYARAVQPGSGRYQLIASTGYRLICRDVTSERSCDLSKHRITCVAFAPTTDARQHRFAAGCRDGKVLVIDCATGEIVDQVLDMSEQVTSLDYSRDGRKLAVGCDDGFVRLVDLANKHILKLGGDVDSVGCVRFSDDGSTLLATVNTNFQENAKGRVDIWNLNSKTRLTMLVPSPVGVAEFDGATNILTAEWNGCLRVWTRDGRPGGVVYDLKDGVSAAAFSPNTASLKQLMDSPVTGS
ncbi:MAG: M56 family metallopeptidase, partial [Planctomycetota bacterium]